MSKNKTGIRLFNIKRYPTLFSRWFLVYLLQLNWNKHKNNLTVSGNVTKLLYSRCSNVAISENAAKWLYGHQFLSQQLPKFGILEELTIHYTMLR